MFWKLFSILFLILIIGQNIQDYAAMFKF